MQALRWLVGVLAALATIAFALLFLIVFVTKIATGDPVAYYAMAVEGAATFGCAVITRWAFRRSHAQEGWLRQLG